ncbi:penicillin amidase [Humibacillus sp. DSM 29435]|uniref:penicillin acylase family protein n=1 Tax=Humibacillus sp. DSM 29435 TaxID=1869167 RepID=UPI000872099F|nr:penicillin acylase family protein [Humibacillus sp. DSM 29435]OFE15015.1 penicillin amidase [Humibacillus sp. DSM 29435]
MSRSKLARRIGLSVVALVLFALVAASILAIGVVRQSFPQTGGELDVEGLTGTVQVQRDARGIPTIYADNAGDLFRAQGYVNAQDRFFEMDYRRHLTAGRLSELVGSGGLEADKVIRTMGWRRVAEQELPKLAPETRQYLQAYADGVNAWVKSKGSPEEMSLEYRVLDLQHPGYRVEPWTPVDSLAWLKAMAWDLRGDYDDELARARLSRGGRIGVKQINLLYPPYPFERNLPILSADDWTPAVQPTAQAAGPIPPALRTASGQAAVDRASAAVEAVPATLGKGEDIGSNSWVVSGTRTTTGKPLLANDPHLSLGIPSIWSQVNLQCRTVSTACPFQVSGFSFAGLPGVVIGHNQKVAWGFTNLGPDVTDFYLEQVTGNTYLRDGASVPLKERTETIKVAGAADVQITVRSTVHGPILSDVIAGINEAGDRVVVRGAPQANSYAVSMAWTALTPSNTADAIFALDKAQNWDQFRAAAALFAVPSQNLVYADTAGHIGYQAPGRIPVRRSSTSGAPPGFWPAPGWDSQWDWKGWVPFDQLPYSYDPPEGFIVTANQAVTASDTPFLTSEWDYGFRAQRIRALLGSAKKVSPEMMTQIQGDVRNTFAPSLIERLLEVQVDDFTAQAQGLLRDWDGTQTGDKGRDGASAAYYNAVWKYLLQYTFDELPPDLAADGGSRWMIVIEQLLKDPKNDWWDDKTTPGVTEGSGEILKRALVEARLDLARKLGKVPATWRWGRLHQLDLQHPVLGGDSVPDVVRSIFNRGGIELGGGNAIVNANSWDAAAPGYDVTTGPSMRMVVDLADLNRSVWVNSTGESGHAYHPNYTDQIDAWAAGESFPWPFTPDAVKAASQAELTLRPPGRQATPSP